MSAGGEGGCFGAEVVEVVVVGEGGREEKKREGERLCVVGVAEEEVPSGSSKLGSPLAVQGCLPRILTRITQQATATEIPKKCISLPRSAVPCEGSNTNYLMELTT